MATNREIFLDKFQGFEVYHLETIIELLKAELPAGDSRLTLVEEALRRKTNKEEASEGNVK